MSALNQVLSGLGVKGAVTRGGAGRGGYLIKTNDAGYLDIETLPFSITAHRTYYVDQYNASSTAAERTGSITSPFREISEALTVNLSEAQGGTPMTVILARGSYTGFTLQSPANNGQTSVTLVSTSPGDSVISSEIQVQTASVAVTLALSGVRSAAISRSSNPGVFNIYLMNRAQAGNLSAISGSTGTVYIFPGCSSGTRTNMTAVWMTSALETNFTIATGTQANWTSVPTLVNTALDQLALRAKSLEDVAAGDVLKLDGTSAFKDTAAQLFNIRRTGFITTVGYVVPAANASVLVPNRSGTLAVIADSAGAGALTDATWSADKLTTQFGLKVNKAGDSMSGPLTLTDTSIKVTEGLDTLTLTVPVLTASRAVTLADKAGVLPVIADSLGAGATDTTWSADKSASQLALKLAKAGDSMSGPLTLTDTSIKITEGLDTLTLTVPVLTASRAVTLADRAGVLPVIGDSLGSGITDATWSADKLVSQFDLKFNKAGGTLTGDLVLADTKTLKFIQGTGIAEYTATVSMPSLAANRAITLPDRAGEFTLMGNAFNAASQLVQMTTETKLPAVDGSLLTSMTKSQVGLTNVTDDAQLKRAANDFAGFDPETDPQPEDLALIEKSSGGTKKRTTLGALATVNNKWVTATCLDNATKEIVLGTLAADRAVHLWLILRVGSTSVYRDYMYKILSDGTSVSDDSEGEYFENGVFPGTATLSTAVDGSSRIVLRIVLAAVGASVTAQYCAIRAPIV